MLWAKKKIRQYVWVILKILVFGTASYIIFRAFESIPLASWNVLNYTLSITSPKIILIFFLFSLANWFIEILKWQTAVKPFSALGFTRAAKETLIAFSYGFVTPLKIGEYGVKTQFYPKHHKKNVVLSQFYCHSSQVLVTLIFGLMGLLNFSQGKWNPFMINWSWSHLAFVLILTALLIYVVKYYRLKASISIATILTVIFLSALRLIIFSSMFVLGLFIMGSQIHWDQSIFGIWTIYLIQVIAPTFSGLDISVKGGSALLVFQDIIPSQIILGAVILQYFVSQILPLFLGLILRPNKSEAI